MKRWIKCFVIFAAIAFIAIGFLRQENLVVLKKAINICLECIGVG